jgi:putative endonuclease
MSKQPCVYILASQRFGTIYIGVTSNLIGRLLQHRGGEIAGFTSRYAVHRLVRYELFATMPEAIAREKQLKRWHRQWKINLIESENPEWIDLAPGLGMEPLPARPRPDGC